jgi:hypothetical protein
MGRLSVKPVLITLLLFGLMSCAEPQSSGTQISTMPTDTDTAPAVTSPETTVPEAGVGSWAIAGDPPRGLVDTPNEEAFISLVELKRIDTKGGEFIVTMKPVVDPNCTQKFRVGWEFERDVGLVLEGDNFNVTVFNEPIGNLAECYVHAKNTMAYGGEVTIELKPSGSSHFLSQDFYKPYHEGDSQYLFVLVTPTGAVYPAGPRTPALSATGTILVKDGVHEIGEMDAPHGNFSFTISAGGVFAYTVTYLYDAIKSP